MASTADIRAALAGGPMTQSEVADALGADDRKERLAVYSAIQQMITQGRGVERLADGKVTLIPGWKPTRGAGSGKPDAKAPKAGKAKAKPRESMAEAKAREATANADLAEATARAMTPGADPAPGGGEPAPAPQPRVDAVVIQRRHLRLLVAHAMAFGDPFDGEMKEAVVTATVLSA